MEIEDIYMTEEEQVILNSQKRGKSRVEIDNEALTRPSMKKKAKSDQNIADNQKISLENDRQNTFSSKIIEPTHDLAQQQAQSIENGTKGFQFDNETHVYASHVFNFSSYEQDRLDNLYRINIVKSTSKNDEHPLSLISVGRLLKKTKITPTHFVDVKKLSKLRVCVIMNNRNSANDLIHSMILRDKELKLSIPQQYSTVIGVMKGVDTDMTA